MTKLTEMLSRVSEWAAGAMARLGPGPYRVAVKVSVSTDKGTETFEIEEPDVSNEPPPGEGP